MAATLESNKSAPMPATSPTLSPTLSAITAGLRGSSSGMPSSTLPVKSALISAVFVKIPPPALANNARELAPKEKPRRMVASPTTQRTAQTPSKLKPTTARPMTAPPRNAIKNAGLMPFCAASAARELAEVATIIPIFPAIADNTVPAMNAIVMEILSTISPFQTGTGSRIKMITAATPANIARTLYSFFMKVFAPALINAETS